MELIWGIVPLYFGWFLNEVTSAKASYRTAIQTGFSFLWAGAQWSYLAAQTGRAAWFKPGFNVSSIVTILVLSVGLVALISGLRKRFPRYCSFIGHSRFSNYFMIAIYPIQANHPSCVWSWDRLAAIAIFAVPIWVIFHFLFQPLRK